MSIGGSANVVKKAVAPASLKGSFFFSSLNAFDNKPDDLVTENMKCCLAIIL